MLGPTVQASLFAIRIELKRELRSDHHLITEWRDCFAKELLILERSVRLGCIEERDATLKRRANQRDALWFVDCRAVAKNLVPCSQVLWPKLQDCFFRVCVFAFVPYLAIRAYGEIAYEARWFPFL